MKYKRIKSALHNLGDSFLGLTNYFHDVLEVTRFRGHPGRGEYGCHGATEA